MTNTINRDRESLNGVTHNHKSNSPGKGTREVSELHRDLRLPSPQRGRGAGGEGDPELVGSCLPCLILPISLAFNARTPLSATRPHTHPLSRVGERGADLSGPLQIKEPKSLLAGSKTLGAAILLAYLWILLFVLSPAALAQAKKADKPAEEQASTKPQATAERQSQVQRVFAIKHADVDAIARTLSIFPFPVQPNRELRVIGVSAPAALLPTIEETIRRLDVPPAPTKNVELTVYLILASDQESSSSSLPPDLESVAKQLMATFAFKAFRAVDTLVVRSRDKQWADVRGLAKLDPDIPNPSTYSFAYRGATVLSDEKGRSIRLDDLRFRAQIGVKKQQAEGSAIIAYETIEAGFGTNVDVREGQKVVVGKAAVGGTNTALILVITAKILD